MGSDFISDDTLVRVGGISGNVSGHIAANRLTRNPDGSLSCTKGDPHGFYVDNFIPEPRRPHPHSLDGLRIRGFTVWPGDTVETDRVLIGPSWYRISEAIERNLI
ncbi:hypothetical protein [Caballeronia sp. ATUFL_M1_KS5A]|uniref:hypothetical protein n=1 Tax=Caballeronia sp. ATUFL_M1_KS5A TaxID=2921778 RepID=UPI002028440B|nr:hypothetical protein [Caballeronia sp. ATUFL_M1_KS5A]